MEFRGIMSAIVTPLNPDRTVNEEQLKNLIEFQISKGVHSILALGGTGEYSALTLEERQRTVEITVRAVNGRVPVVIGVLEPGIGEATRFSQICRRAGADAILVLTPFYVHPTQQGIVDFYTTLDRAVDMPILVYNIPYRTCVNVLPETMERLAGEMKNLAGMKECNPSSAQAIEMLRRVGDKIDVLTGEEFDAVSVLALGFKGAVMATANLVPDVWVDMYELIQNNEVPRALEIFKQYFPLFKTLFSETNPGPLKYAMERIGVPCGGVTLPLVPPAAETVDRLEAEMKQVGLI